MTDVHDAEFSMATATPPRVRPPRPPAGAPDVLVVMLDDTGFAHLGSFGSGLSTPSMDALAAGGLRYNRFHVTAMCSPTRASFLTGRNHHAVGMGALADIPVTYPGYTARMPASAAPLPSILREAGYATFAVGKWHLTPRGERSAAGPFRTWPLGTGFDRYYGFLQGDTNHWAPNLVCDNHYIDPPRRPSEGYHLSEDLADQAIRMLRDLDHAAPGKPFFMYFATGAMHSPHHVTEEWVRPFEGRFDEGWDSWRSEIFGRQLAAGIVPEGTVLTERPPWIDDWGSLSADERRMHARQQEVFAGFLAHTDAQIGRVLGELEAMGRLDNTLVLLLSDNGASAEGGRLGSVNEHRFTARIPERLDDNLRAVADGEWGGFRTYNHYSWAWAWAGNTPLRLWKRYTWLGGTRAPLVVHWPARVGAGAAGTVRPQFAHAIDLFPTILEAAGLDPAAVGEGGEFRGIPQQRLDGRSIVSTFDDPDAPAPRSRQYFELLGSRSIVDGRYKATTDHVSIGVLDEEALLEGSRRFEDDHWAVFDLESDFSEARDLSAELPDEAERLASLWLEEAAVNQVLPVDDSLVNRLRAMYPLPYGHGPDREFRPGAGPVFDESVPMLFGGFRVSAHVVADPDGGPADGVLCALGDWNGGWALFLAGGQLVFAFNRAGEAIEAVSGPGEVDRRTAPGGRHVIEAAFVPEHDPADGEPSGTIALMVDGEIVGSVAFDGSWPAALQHGGAGLRLGCDVDFPVSTRYAAPAHLTGLELESLRIRVPRAAPDPLDELRTALHAD